MILGIDTSLGTALAVVELDGVVRAAAASANPLAHAEVIGDLLERVLGEATLGPVGATTAAQPIAVTHVAAGMGPGPFTGLRVGIAAATAFALARGVPVIPVASHDAVALEVLLADAIAGEETPRFAVVTDARRREFAYSVYDGLDDDGLPVRTAGPALVPRDDLDARLGELGARRHDAAAVPAQMLALVAARAIAAGREVAGSEPLYLRSPDVSVPAPRKKVGA
ncbi:tRNA (adenosine(37)-N6)-threonylcarbamoyltransferase complex dimerization subunit type 1 TsaB [Microbacterium sp. zg-Y818]|uniref:tRNA (adenosine(37)-N6)-threonylcarbamoyltransferase complex dimerization subunit type 1 TsaB n=1 Tax=unclassified Microbacterium TaxID=2609290 RepID=UPI00214B05E6|nr:MULTISPECIES: tRNA (adenosine(37)-N6)-threonylcarbamoyltransferase complex dimerization subunit type 1 TsaB [unclassified Microbacterium]MCR2801886.1 tRNA (adenosine(37)-N6)-threonylcarbamoyltransferase complex dimerization subunit type 1 TsaB [Microbacterium sp. zg.Y818]WIM22857.1 tRNA (adenosine(37)-N6)-threonylcarbamoyltransferase complex dimerization subunit type 1 TsaB [Microbacterium sp. zg-Y818]